MFDVFGQKFFCGFTLIIFTNVLSQKYSLLRKWKCHTIKSEKRRYRNCRSQLFLEYLKTNVNIRSCGHCAINDWICQSRFDIYIINRPNWTSFCRSFSFGRAISRISRKHLNYLSTCTWHRCTIYFNFFEKVQISKIAIGRLLFSSGWNGPGKFEIATRNNWRNKFDQGADNIIISVLNHSKESQEITLQKAAFVSFF